MINQSTAGFITKLSNILDVVMNLLRIVICHQLLIGLISRALSFMTKNYFKMKCF
jgi:hypothetical protein